MAKPISNKPRGRPVKSPKNEKIDQPKDKVVVEEVINDDDILLDSFIEQKIANYRDNPNLKKEGVSIQFTQEQFNEYARCSIDPVYFIKRYVKIINLDRGLMPFEMYPFQERLVDQIHGKRFNIVKIPRQSGKTTTTISYLLWVILFQPEMSVALAANRGSLARDILAKLQLSYE